VAAERRKQDITDEAVETGAALAIFWSGPVAPVPRGPGFPERLAQNPSNSARPPSTRAPREWAEEEDRDAEDVPLKSAPGEAEAGPQSTRSGPVIRGYSPSAVDQ